MAKRTPFYEVKDILSLKYVGTELMIQITNSTVWFGGQIIRNNRQLGSRQKI